MVLLDCAEKALLGDLYLLALADGLEEALLASGQGPVVNVPRDTLRRFAATHAIDGIVLALGADRTALARELADKGHACVVINEFSEENVPGVGWVLLDLDSGAREAARMFLSLGHRQIGFIGNYETDLVRLGFSDELMNAGVPLKLGMEEIAGKGREAGKAAMRRLLSLPERPTAVFARTDLLASGALEAAREMRIRVPEDVSVIGHDDIPPAAKLRLTTVRIDCVEMGRAAAQVLSRLREDRFAAGKPPMVRTRLIARETVAPPP